MGNKQSKKSNTNQNYVLEPLRKKKVANTLPSNSNTSSDVVPPPPYQQIQKELVNTPRTGNFKPTDKTERQFVSLEDISQLPDPEPARNLDQNELSVDSKSNSKPKNKTEKQKTTLEYLYDHLTKDNDDKALKTKIEKIKTDIELVMNHDRCRKKLKVESLWKVEAYGSSVNGLSLQSSDIDFCLTLSGSDTLEKTGLMKKKAIRESTILIMHVIKNFFKENGLFEVVENVTRTRVPVLKLRHVESKTDIDLVLYNCLALRNTKLLKTYVEFDPTVKMMCIITKKIFKAMGICDAKNGFFSSYAVIVIVIHFLQFKNIVPDLQKNAEDYDICVQDGKGKDWNTYFAESLTEIEIMRKNCISNETSLSELFVEFLEFLAKDSTWSKLICINEITDESYLIKQQKKFRVVDPFDHSHNLCRNMTNRKYGPIMKKFQVAYQYFQELSTKDPFQENLLDILSPNNFKIKNEKQEEQQEEDDYDKTDVNSFENTCIRFVTEEMAFEQEQFDNSQLTNDAIENGAAEVSRKFLRKKINQLPETTHTLYTDMLWRLDYSRNCIVFELEKDAACLEKFEEIMLVSFHDDNIKQPGIVLATAYNADVIHRQGLKPVSKWNRYVAVELFEDPSNVDDNKEIIPANLEKFKEVKEIKNRFLIAKRDYLLGVVSKRYLENLRKLRTNFQNKNLYELTKQGFNGLMNPDNIQPSATSLDEFKLFNDKLRPSQRDCLDRIRNSRFPLVSCQGPPGTGKTTVIVELILQLVKNGKRVLISASSNTAVDNVLIKLVTTYEKIFDEINLRLVRTGSESHIDSDNINPTVRRYTWKTILERKNKSENLENEKLNPKNKQKAVEKRKRKEKSVISSRNDLVNDSNVIFCTADSCNPSLIRNGKKFGLDAYDY